MSLRVKRGLVVAVSSGARNEQGNLVTLMVNEGDEVLFTGDGIEIEEEGHKYLILREGEVFCKVQTRLDDDKSAEIGNFG